MTDAKTPGEPRRIIPALGPLYDSLSPYAYPLIRFICGYSLIPHGYGKLFGGGLQGAADFFAQMGLQPALPLATFVGILEFFGGILLAVGLLTRPVALLVVGFMAVAVLQVHWPNGYLWISLGYEYPLFWGVVALAVAVRGGGPLSIDRALGHEF